jgi:hypothetical protein
MPLLFLVNKRVTSGLLPPAVLLLSTSRQPSWADRMQPTNGRTLQPWSANKPRPCRSTAGFDRIQTVCL